MLGDGLTMPWYVIHAYSGHEQKVKLNLEQRLIALGLDEEDFSIFVPTQEVAQVKDGKKRISVRTFFPGYVLISLKELGKEIWHLVRSTPGVINFVGSGSNPTPLREEEVENILQVTQSKEKPTPVVSYTVGDKVKVIDGPFTGFPGEVDEVDEERQKIRLMISIFGRSTPVELEFFQVEKI
jgi:transcriptional antiterminator NusG